MEVVVVVVVEEEEADEDEDDEEEEGTATGGGKLRLPAPAPEGFLLTPPAPPPVLESLLSEACAYIMVEVCGEGVCEWQTK